MKPADDMHKLIRKLEIKASSELDRRVHNDISRAAAESKPAVGPGIWSIRLAVAAVVIIAFGAGFFVGQQSKSIPSAAYSIDVASYTTRVSAYQAGEGGFWRQKVVAAMRPRPHSQGHLDKTGLLKNYRQYLKERNYD